MDSNYVLAARRALRMTQAEFAKALGLSQPSVSRYENGGDVDDKTRLAVRGLLAEKRVRLRPAAAQDGKATT